MDRVDDQPVQTGLSLMKQSSGFAVVTLVLQDQPRQAL